MFFLQLLTLSVQHYTEDQTEDCWRFLNGEIGKYFQLQVLIKIISWFYSDFTMHSQHGSSKSP